MKIEIAVDNIEAAFFVEWLRGQGHDAYIGKSTGNYVDGEWASENIKANEILNELWEQYCQEA